MYYVIIFTLFWFSLEFISYYIWNYFFKRKIRKLQLLEQNQFYTKTVAFFHATIISYLSIINLYKIFIKHEYEIFFSKNSIYFMNEEFKYAISITLSYFIWDIFTCFKEKQSIDIFIHAFMGFIATYFSLSYHVLPFYVILFSLYEFSTTFLNLRWFLIKLDMNDNNIFKIIQNSFGYSFVFFRIFIGFIIGNPLLLYDIYINYQYFYINKIEIPFYFVIISKILSDILNIYWSVKILKMKKRI